MIITTKRKMNTAISSSNSQKNGNCVRQMRQNQHHTHHTMSIMIVIIAILSTLSKTASAGQNQGITTNSCHPWYHRSFGGLLLTSIRGGDTIDDDDDDDDFTSTTTPGTNDSLSDDISSPSTNDSLSDDISSPSTNNSLSDDTSSPAFHRGKLSGGGAAALTAPSLPRQHHEKQSLSSLAVTVASGQSSSTTEGLLHAATGKRGGAAAIPVGRVRSRLLAMTSDDVTKAAMTSDDVNASADASASIDLMNGLNATTRGGPLRVLFLSSDTGGGHRASAEALAVQFLRFYPNTTYSLLDVWTADGCLPYRTLVPAYKHLSAHPRQWRLLYHVSNTGPYMLAVDVHSTLTCERKIRRRIESYDPDVVVSVHPAMNNVPIIATKKLSKKLGKKIPFFTVVTDFGSGHCTWFKRSADRVYIASDRIRRLAKRRGWIEDDNLIQAGLPIRHQFAEEAAIMGDRRSERGKAYQKQMRTELGLPEGKPMVLLMGGGEGVGSLSQIVDSLYVTLAKQGVDATIAVVCGRNQKLLKQLEARDWQNVMKRSLRLKKRRHFHRLRWMVPSKRIRESLARAAKLAKEGKLMLDEEGYRKTADIDVVGLGFVTDMAKYMVAADILVSKAGPGTIAEAAALGLPVMLTSFLPGQEAGNVNIVLDGGFGDFCDEPWGISEEVACWLQDEPLLDIMSRAARSVGKPNAAMKIVQDIGDITHRYMEENKNSGAEGSSTTSADSSDYNEDR